MGLLAALSLLLGLIGAASPGSAPGSYYGFHYCTSFRASHPVRVYEQHMPCRKAVRIQKEYWLAPSSRKVVVNGGVGARGYVLLKRFPGWKCTAGSGGGECAKGRKVALYQD